ncbi:pentapeptide repeat-containing protein [Streptomyces chartreusis]|uniref:pentapeptide repeat-containing protein n=1 Tax=Streptomyces chartreusis TaxID=1969 RepID=UPI0033CF8C4F
MYTLRDSTTGKPHVGTARFDEATFSGPASFSRAAFSGDASFTSAAFSGDASFNGTAFSAEARFEETAFSDDASFDQAAFSGPASFDQAAFSGPASFTRAAFSGEARFDGATFSRPAWFGKVTFSSPASFSGAAFSGYDSFVQATFSAEARFDGATFSGNAWFDEATFEAASRLGPVVCNGTLILSGARFASPVTIEVAAARLECRGTRWDSQAALRLRHATVDLSDGVYEYPLSGVHREVADHGSGVSVGRATRAGRRPVSTVKIIGRSGSGGMPGSAAPVTASRCDPSAVGTLRDRGRLGDARAAVDHPSPERTEGPRRAVARAASGSPGRAGGTDDREAGGDRAGGPAL